MCRIKSSYDMPLMKSWVCWIIVKTKHDNQKNLTWNNPRCCQGLSLKLVDKHSLHKLLDSGQWCHNCLPCWIINFNIKESPLEIPIAMLLNKIAIFYHIWKEITQSHLPYNFWCKDISFQKIYFQLLPLVSLNQRLVTKVLISKEYNFLTWLGKLVV